MGSRNQVTWIATIVMFLTVAAFVVTATFGGRLSLDVNLEEEQRNEYRRAVILENMLTLEAGGRDYPNYPRARAVIPVEYFTQRGGEMGYRVRNGHCYIQSVPLLDGRDYGFYVSPLTSPDKHSSSVRELGCTGKSVPSGRISSGPALLIRKTRNNPPLMVRVNVYQIQ